MKTLVVVDTHIFAHIIDYRLADKQDASFVRYFSRAYTHFLAAGLWLPEGYDRNNHSVVFCGDVKPYWRNEYFSKVGVFYKQNRNNSAGKTARVEAIVTEMARSVVELGGQILRKYDDSGYGFEADDWAGSICRLKDEDTRIMLLTSDIDWLGLTHIPNVHWLNSISSKGVHGRVTNAQNFCEWFNSREDHQCALRKGFRVKDPSDIYRFKALYGDKSDNIPPFKDASKVIGLISLLEPTSRLEDREDMDVMDEVSRGTIVMNGRLTYERWSVKAKLPKLFSQITLDDLRVVT